MDNAAIASKSSIKPYSAKIDQVTPEPEGSRLDESSIVAIYKFLKYLSEYNESPLTLSMNHTYKSLISSSGELIPSNPLVAHVCIFPLSLNLNGRVMLGYIINPSFSVTNGLRRNITKYAAKLSFLSLNLPKLDKKFLSKLLVGYFPSLAPSNK